MALAVTKEQADINARQQIEENNKLGRVINNGYEAGNGPMKQSDRGGEIGSTIPLPTPISTSTVAPIPSPIPASTPASTAVTQSPPVTNPDTIRTASASATWKPPTWDSMQPTDQASWLMANSKYIDPKAINDVNNTLNSTPGLMDAVSKIHVESNTPIHYAPLGTQAIQKQGNPYSQANSIRTLSAKAQDNQVSQFAQSLGLSQQQLAESIKQNGIDNAYRDKAFAESANQFAQQMGLSQVQYANTLSQWAATFNHQQSQDTFNNALNATNATGYAPKIISDMYPGWTTNGSAGNTSNTGTSPVSLPSSVVSSYPGATNVSNLGNGSYKFNDAKGNLVYFNAGVGN